MAATVPASHYIENAGSKVLHIVTFPDTADDTNTWASGIQGIVGYWANGTDDPTQTKEGIDVRITDTATGTFTFSLGEDNRSFILYVLSNT
jgi:hypothetical protein